jgi:hypothetical protein
MGLFDQKSLVHVTSNQNPATLSKEQKAFYRHIKQIEEHRQLIQSWESLIPKINSLIHNDLASLRKRFIELRTQFTIRLDQNYGVKGLTKTENTKIRKLILHWCQDLLVSAESNPAPDVVAVYDKHTGGDYMQEQEEFGEEMKSLLGDMFNLDLDDEPTPQSAEDMSKILRKHMFEKMQAMDAEEDAGAVDPNPADDQPSAHQTRKPSAKTLAKEAREQEESKHMEQSLREIYRKLASSLHPDREPDEHERARKTQLMQRVNMAYDQKDLLKLLELQLEIEQIGQNDIQAIANSRLKHYNKILSEQLRNLKDVIEGFEMQFNNPSLRGAVKPQTVLHTIHTDIREMASLVKDTEENLTITDNILQLKNWLKAMRLSDFEERVMFMN